MRRIIPYFIVIIILIFIYSCFINERVKSAYTGVFGIILFALVAYKYTGMKEVIILLSCIVILIKFIAIKWYCNNKYYSSSI